ncbi:hypothetical protein TSAR_009587 [Trichomalopsis sarcophagae]|uniref:Uncharacterized protein n=1 Tax=Trichomalopsis sarcophagae TaxID=543379 RepID=A0A232ERY9_9HYME|nr:hypothetical protein TSAR_009587 [Trichomalopsis sarcophagae]
MIRLPGKQANTTLYIHNGYSYHRDPRGAGLIFRCAIRGTSDCSATIYVQTLQNLEHQEIYVSGEHNHGPDPLLLLRKRFDTALKARARERATVDEPKDVYDHVAALPE